MEHYSPVVSAYVGSPVSNRFDSHPFGADCHPLGCNRVYRPPMWLIASKRTYTVYNSLQKCLYTSLSDVGSPTATRYRALVRKRSGRSTEYMENHLDERSHESEDSHIHKPTECPMIERTFLSPASDSIPCLDSTPYTAAQHICVPFFLTSTNRLHMKKNIPPNDMTCHMSEVVSASSLRKGQQTEVREVYQRERRTPV